VVLIEAECALRHINVEQFEDAVGWRLKGFMDSPERLFEDMTVDGCNGCLWLSLCALHTPQPENFLKVKRVDSTRDEADRKN
jgi:hypothetical protein